MKVLSLIIKQNFFNEILKGTKTKEYREVKPTTIKKLLQLDSNGYEVVDEYGNAQPIKYDAIKFYVGYNKDRDSALVEVKDAYCEIFTHTVWLKANDKGEIGFYKLNENGEYLEDENGNLIEANENEENVAPFEVEEGKGVKTELPNEYEYNGDLWVEEQVVFELGKVLEKDIH